jgi:hypothetical protein
MTARATTEDDAVILTAGNRRTRLAPCEGFALAAELLRAATAAIVHDEADHALVRCVLRDGEVQH